jgi:outer membrane receptor protein involved in Fe transport
MNSADLVPDTLARRSFDAVGNRSLKPQRTVAYEVGLKGNMTDVLGFTITAYYKDITDLVGTKQIRVGTKYNYALFRNIDYASVMGLELGLNRSMNEHWALEANYTYSVAKGNSSEPLQGFWNAYYQQPMAMQEYYLDFDRRHLLNAMLTWQSDPLTHQSMLKNLTTGITLGVTASWASGLPYTPYTGAGEQLALTNSARMDPTAVVDVRFAKELAASGSVRLTLLGYVENLFDTQNDLVVNTQTGQPWQAPLEGNQIAFDQLHDPSRVDNPRIIKIGLSAKF